MLETGGHSGMEPGTGCRSRSGILRYLFHWGIVARNVGMTPIQGMITSALCNASAGEYAGFTMIAAGGSVY